MLRCPRLFALNYIWYEHSDQIKPNGFSPFGFISFYVPDFELVSEMRLAPYAERWSVFPNASNYELLGVTVVRRRFKSYRLDKISTVIMMPKCIVKVVLVLSGSLVNSALLFTKNKSEFENSLSNYSNVHPPGHDEVVAYAVGHFLFVEDDRGDE